tara:strand:+ start:1680 stop:1949 length:270 start_codon:yes stop_codon:yes gene_type:complete
VVVISGKPYTDSDDIRMFNVGDDQKEFVWHRDKEDRIFEVLEGEAWQLQYNGSIPILLEERKTYYIPKMMYHRLIKGYNNLKVKINVKF